MMTKFTLHCSIFQFFCGIKKPISDKRLEYSVLICLVLFFAVYKIVCRYEFKIKV